MKKYLVRFIETRNGPVPSETVEAESFEMQRDFVSFMDGKDDLVAIYPIHLVFSVTTLE